MDGENDERQSMVRLELSACLLRVLFAQAALGPVVELSSLSCLSRVISAPVSTFETEQQTRTPTSHQHCYLLAQDGRKSLPSFQD